MFVMDGKYRQAICYTIKENFAEDRIRIEGNLTNGQYKTLHKTEKRKSLVFSLVI